MEKRTDKGIITLEKEYCRLTLDIPQGEIRNYETLTKAYAHVLNKYLTENINYTYIKNQLLSIRQEITIQHIQDKFAIKVYENNARISIENSDLINFNQCQTALIQLYKINKDDPFLSTNDNQLEFFRYRMLYFAFYDERELIHAFNESQYKVFKLKCKDIIELIHYVNEKNYCKVFLIKDSLSQLEQKLLNPFIPRLKILSLIIFSLGYYTEVSISFITNCLCFECQNDCIVFLDELKIIFDQKKENIKCRESLLMIKQSKYLNKIFT